VSVRFVGFVGFGCEFDAIMVVWEGYIGGCFFAHMVEFFYPGAEGARVKV